MIQRTRGNGIPSWPEALRRAALPALRGPGTPSNATLSAPARVWRAGKLAEHRRSGFSRDSIPDIGRG
jgi:hypothetical protein